MKISKVQFILFVVFVIYPLAALPIILLEIYNRNYYALNYLAIFMGLLAYLWIPSGDLYTYQLDFEFLKTLNFQSFTNLTIFDFVLPGIMFLIGKLNLNFEFVRFTLCIVSYILYFRIYTDIIQSNPNLTDSKIISFSSFLIFFFFLRFTGYLTGVRFTFSMSLCFYSVYLLIYKNKKIGWLFLSLSAFTHFSMWAIVIIVAINKIIKFKIYRFYFLLALVTGFFLSTFFIEYIINLLPIGEVLKIHLANYTTGYYAKGEFANHSIGFRLASLFSYVAIYPALILVLYNIKEYSFFSIFAFICIILSVVFEMNSTYNRYAFLGVIFFIIPFLLQYKISFTKTSFYFFLILSIFVYSTSIYSVKRELSCGYQYKILYLPLPLIFMSTYNLNWLYKNITPNGDLRFSSN